MEPRLAMKYTIHQSIRIVVTTWSGRLTDSSLTSSYMELFNDEAWNPDFNELADFRDADVSQITKKGLEAIADMSFEFEGNKKSAILVSQDLSFGLARIYEVLTESSSETARVFRDPIIALAWLGAPPDLLDQT